MTLFLSIQQLSQMSLTNKYRSLRAFQAHEFEQRKEFVKCFGMFQNWAPRYRKMMAYSLKKQTLRFEDTIVKQGTPVDGIYFIIK